MTKYDPLEKHLSRAGKPEIPMRFEEIERIIDSPLPASARKHRAWWSNNATNHVNALAWLRAGYETADVDIEDETLVFRRVKKAEQAAKKRHSIFGCMAGTITIADGVDLTEPAMPEWAEMIKDPKL